MEKFLEVCNKVLDKHAPRKSKCVRGNHSPFMKRDSPFMKFFKEKTVENRKNYNKRSYCVTLLRKVKKEHYGRLDEKDVTHNKTFWKTAKPFLSDKTVKFPTVTLFEKSEIISNQEKIAETFNTFFTDIVSSLKIPPYQDADFARGIVGGDPITFILKKYKNHSSIIVINIFCHENKSFNFETIKREYILKKIKSLDIQNLSKR